MANGLAECFVRLSVCMGGRGVRDIRANVFREEGGARRLPDQNGGHVWIPDDVLPVTRDEPVQLMKQGMQVLPDVVRWGGTWRSGGWRRWRRVSEDHSNHSDTLSGL